MMARALIRQVRRNVIIMIMFGRPPTVPQATAIPKSRDALENLPTGEIRLTGNLKIRPLPSLRAIAAQVTLKTIAQFTSCISDK